MAHRGVPLRLQGLSKRFGSVQALRALDLDIETGELVAFLGPSGCGKTTTLLLIAGIYRASEGAIFFGDQRVDALHPRDRDVGMVFQSYALYPHLSLFENIAFPLRLKRTPRAEVEQRVEQAAELLGIASSSVGGRRRCRAASSSAPHWRARWSRSRACCCSTSRCRTSTHRSACTRAARSADCSRSWASPACW
jgi:ABC-type Fe3+/spermidine/putrescine transport system ATPase subunit